MAKTPSSNQFEREHSKRKLLRDALRPNEERDIAFRRMILSIPPGRVSTYGAVAAAAGYPRYHRAVARLLRTDPPDQLPGTASSAPAERSSYTPTPPRSSAPASNSKASSSPASASTCNASNTPSNPGKSTAEAPGPARLLGQNPHPATGLRQAIF